MELARKVVEEITGWDKDVSITEICLLEYCLPNILSSSYKKRTRGKFSQFSSRFRDPSLHNSSPFRENF